MAERKRQRKDKDEEEDEDEYEGDEQEDRKSTSAAAAAAAGTPMVAHDSKTSVVEVRALTRVGETVPTTADVDHTKINDMFKEKFHCETKLTWLEHRSGNIVTKYTASCGDVQYIVDVIPSTDEMAKKSAKNIADVSGHVPTIKIKHIVESEGKTYIGYESVKGYISLAEFIKELEKKKQNPFSNLLKISQENLNLIMYIRVICHNLRVALSKLHSEGYAHNNIKPENILVNTKTWEVLLIGFENTCSGKDCRNSQAGDLLYAPPELFQSGYDRKVALCQKADIFALGLTILDLITGIWKGTYNYWIGTDGTLPEIRKYMIDMSQQNLHKLLAFYKSNFHDNDAIGKLRGYIENYYFIEKGWVNATKNEKFIKLVNENPMSLFKLLEKDPNKRSLT